MSHIKNGLKSYSVCLALGNKESLIRARSLVWSIRKKNHQSTKVLKAPCHRKTPQPLFSLLQFPLKCHLSFFFFFPLPHSSALTCHPGLFSSRSPCLHTSSHSPHASPFISSSASLPSSILLHPSPPLHPFSLPAPPPLPAFLGDPSVFD